MHPGVFMRRNTVTDFEEIGFMCSRTKVGQVVWWFGILSMSSSVTPHWCRNEHRFQRHMLPSTPHVLQLMHEKPVWSCDPSLMENMWRILKYTVHLKCVYRKNEAHNHLVSSMPGCIEMLWEGMTILQSSESFIVQTLLCLKYKSGWTLTDEMKLMSPNTSAVYCLHSNKNKEKCEKNDYIIICISICGCRLIEM